MEREHELLSTEIVNRGIEHCGPNAGSMKFSVRVRPRLADFATPVNLKYAKLGYTHLLGNAFYFLFAPILIVVCNIIGKRTWQDFYSNCDSIDALFMLAFLGIIICIYLELTPRSTYLVDISCYRPPNELKISKEEFIQLAKNSGKFNDAAIKFQERALKNSGIGDESYMPRRVFCPGQKTLKDGREEAAMAIFGAVDDLLAATNIRPKDIKVLIVNCGVLNTTPSLSAMVIHHYKLSHNINSYNLGGMGCAAGIIAIDVAKDLLNAYPGSYALVVSAEAVTYTWYDGNDTNMLLPNCFVRMGAAAMLLSSCRLDRLRSKYELKQLVRTHKGMDNRSFKSIYLKEDKEGRQGLSVSKDIIEVGGHALEANITTLAHLVLPTFGKIRFFIDLLFEKSKTNYKKKSCLPNIMLAFDHICISATSKKVLDEIQKNLGLTEEHMEASRKTLDRFGNTSSSSIWYELAFLEANKRIKNGDRIWQVAFGSGFKCNSVVWKALKDVKRPNRSPWILNSI